MRLGAASTRRTFRALANRNYRLFWTGQVVSLTGTWMQRLAQAWLVLELTDSPFALGLITTIQFLPIMTTSLFAGVLADRFPKRRILLVTQSVMMVQSLVLAILASTPYIRVEHIYILAGILGIASAVDNPTRQSFIVEMVGPDDLPNAVALNSTQFNTARIAGPSLGGVGIAVIGVAGCFYLNAFSYLATLIGLLMMRESELFNVPARVTGNMFKQVGAGLSYSLRTPDIALVLLLMAMLGTFGYNFTVLLPLIATYVLHSGELGFGILTSAMAVGSLGSALWIAHSGRATRRTLFIGAIGFTIALLVLGISEWWALTLPVLVVLGLFSIVFTATANTRLQLMAPPEMRGRVMSLYTLLFAGTTPVGSLVIGWLAEHQSVQATVLEMAGLCALGVAIATTYLRLNATRLTPEGARPPAAAPVAKVPDAVAPMPAADVRPAGPASLVEATDDEDDPQVA